MLKLIRSVISILLVILLLPVGIGAGAILSVRNAYTEENVTEMLTSIQWADLELPYEGSSASLCSIVNDILVPYNIYTISPEEFNEAVHAVAADRLASDYILQLRAWFFDGAERPRLKAEELSEVIVKAVGVLFFNTDEVEAKIPAAPKNRISLLSAKQEQESIDAIIDRYNLPPDYAAMLKELAKEHPDLDILELMELLAAQQAGASGSDTAEDAIDSGKIPFFSDLIPEDFDFSDLLESLTGAKTDTDAPAQDNEETPVFEESEPLSFTDAIKALLMEQLTAAVSSQLECEEAVEEWNRILDMAEPYRIAVSSLTLQSLFFCAGLLALILFLVNLKNFSGWVRCMGFAAAVVGLVFFLLPKCADTVSSVLSTEYQIPEATFCLIADPLFSASGAMGINLLAAGASVLLLGIILGALRKKR